MAQIAEAAAYGGARQAARVIETGATEIAAYVLALLSARRCYVFVTGVLGFFNFFGAESEP